MMTEPRSHISRRKFIQHCGALGGGAVLAKRVVGAAASGGLPMRVLGKTGLKVSTLTLGTWPCGMCKELGAEGVERLVHEALELGINSIDTARAYGHGETAIGRVIRGHRDRLILATKTWADTADAARDSLEQSLRELGTDHVDIVYLHSVGDRDVAKAKAQEGALEYLLSQKRSGKTRFVGISGHSRPAEFVPLIESGDIDVALLAMNFADR